MKSRIPITLSDPTKGKTTYFESIRACARSLKVDHSHLRYRMKWVGHINGMTIKEVQNG